jgi:hypothetical protein
MDINYKGSQGQTERVVALQEEEEEFYGDNTHTTVAGNMLNLCLF